MLDLIELHKEMYAFEVIQVFKGGLNRKPEPLCKRPEDYPSFTVASISPDFSPVPAVPDVLATTHLGCGHSFCGYDMM